jgi:hypothetical protein
MKRLNVEFDIETPESNFAWSVADWDKKSKGTIIAADPL